MSKRQTNSIILWVVCWAVFFSCGQQQSSSEERAKKEKVAKETLQQPHASPKKVRKEESSATTTIETSIETSIRTQEETTELTKAGLQRTSILNGLQYFEGMVHVQDVQFTLKGLIMDPQKFILAVAGLNPETLSGYSLGGFQSRSNALAVITGGFRSPQNLPLGLVISERKLFNRLDQNSPLLKGILVIQKNSVDIIHRDEFDSLANYDHALQSGPMIVKKGGINGILQREKETKLPYTRSFVAKQKEGKILLAVTSPVHLFDLAEFLRAPSDKGLDCDVALNLEGGGGEGLIIKAGDMDEMYGNLFVRRPNAIIVRRIQ